MNPEQIVAAARRYLGTPFRHLGRDASGLDCAGLLLAVARDLGLGEPPPLAYSAAHPALALIDRWLPVYADPVVEPSAGDLIRLRVAGRPQHLAVRAEHPAAGHTLIHAWPTLGGVVEHRIDARWSRRIAAAWRLREVA